MSLRNSFHSRVTTNRKIYKVVFSIEYMINETNDQKERTEHTVLKDDRVLRNMMEEYVLNGGTFGNFNGQTNGEIYSNSTKNNKQMLDHAFYNGVGL